MNRRSYIVVCGMALAGLAAALIFSGSRTVRAQTPTPVPGNDRDRVVYLGLSRTGGGAVEFSDPRRYECIQGERTLHMASYVAEPIFRITSTDCDELWRILNARMDARWEILVRELITNEHRVQFGTHHGGFTWTDEHNKVVGTMDGTIGCGTHRRPIMECEHCRVPDHFEGLLRGEFTRGDLTGRRVEASYSGKIIRDGHQSRMYINIDGVFILPCRHEPPPPPPPPRHDR